jgi:hypothetical protein
MTTQNHESRRGRIASALGTLFLVALVQGPTLGLAHAAVAMQDSAPVAVQAEPAETLPGALEILERATEATGGREAQLAKVHRTGAGTFAVPSQGISGTLSTRASAPHFILVEVEIPGLGLIRSGYNGETAWTLNPVTGPMVLEGDDLEQMREEANFHDGLNPTTDYTAMKTLGVTDFAGQRCYEVELVRPSGKTVREFFNVESGLPVGRVGPQSTPMGTVEVTAVILEYAEVNGVQVASRMKQTTLGMDEVVHLETMDFDPIDPAVFALPAEIEAMLEQAPVSGDGGR